MKLDYIQLVLYKWLDNFLAYLPNVFISLILIIAGFVLTKKVRDLAEKWNPHFLENFAYMRRFLVLGVIGFFWAVIILLVLDLLNLTSFLTHLLAGAGIIGVIGGFAVKDVVSNAFSGMIIRSYQPYKKGDWVNVNGYIGVVDVQGLILTGIRTIQGQRAWVPNNTILQTSYLNYSTYGKARVIVNFGVSYGDNLDFVEKVTMEEILKLPEIIEPEKADFYFVNVGSSTYNFEARFWINYHERPDFLRAQSHAIKALKARFDKEGICVAYNVMTLDFGVKGGVNLHETQVPVRMLNPEPYPYGTPQHVGAPQGVPGASQAACCAKAQPAPAQSQPHAVEAEPVAKTENADAKPAG